MPNFFDYATSELSQDAFLCWLLSWAKPIYATTDPALHRVAVRLVQGLLSKAGKEPPTTVESIEVHKQWHHIDVFAVINNRYAIIIEDKVYCVNHSEQLTRYREEVLARKDAVTGSSPLELVPIYLKTRDQSNYRDVEGKGYTPFKRSDLLSVLRIPEGERATQNAIFCDFLSALDRIEERVTQYRSVPVCDWEHLAWTGFFMDLQSRLGDGDWGYVPNRSGGFWGFWWHGKEQPMGDAKPYLQLEERDLCFKVEIPESQRAESAISRQWWEEIARASQAPDAGLSVERPRRLGVGQWVTVARLKSRQYMRLSGDLIDFDETLEVLKAAEKLLDRTCELARTASCHN